MADAETTREIRAAVRQILACFNVGDIPRATGLMTKRGVEGVFSGLIVTEDGRELARTRITTELRAEGNLVNLFAVTDLSVLRDERVCALVLLDEALLPPDGAETLLFVFAKQNGRWHLDDWADFTIVPGGAGTNATPTP